MSPEPSNGLGPVLHAPFGTQTHVCCDDKPGCVGKDPMPVGMGCKPPGNVAGNVGIGGSGNCTEAG